jgi:hypothetical protein
MTSLVSSPRSSQILLRRGVKPTLGDGVGRHSVSLVAAQNNRHFQSCYTRNNFGIVAFIASLLVFQILSSLKIYWGLSLMNTSSSTNEDQTQVVRTPTAFGSNPRSVVWVVEYGKVMSISILDGYKVYTVRDDHEGDDYSSSRSESEDSQESYDDDQNCVFHTWQTSQHPACNVFHELVSSPTIDLSLLAQGGMAQVYKFSHDQHNHSNNNGTLLTEGRVDEPTLVLKTLRYPRMDIEEWTVNNVRVDSVISERLTSSPYIMNSYGYCGSSVLSPLAAHGSLRDVLRPIWKAGKDLHPMDKLKVAIQITKGVAELHTVGQDDNDQGSHPHINFAHNDLHMKQWVYYDGIFQLNDFNYGRMLKHDLNHNNETCQSFSDMSTNVWRAPEDLAQMEGKSGTFRVEMADMYTLGFMLFKILHPANVPEKISFKDFKRGESPIISSRIRRNPNKAVQALITMIDACWAHVPEERPTADEVAKFLNESMRQILGPKMQDGDWRINLTNLMERSCNRSEC